MMFLNLLSLGTSLLTCAAAQSVVTVSIGPGAITGAQCTATNVIQFLGIPYAEPPTGDLRFAAPVPYAGSYPGGGIAASALPPACIQFGTAFIATGPEAEDCLFINIWAPANATATSNLPVKFWIYGGADDAGFNSDPLYNGCNLATDTIVVAANYRVGALGFLSLESAGITGNYGVQDLLLALQWVQDNISAFGGDPKQVLVFGQSAGAGLTWLLSSLPQAPSLMAAGISESGAGRTLVPIAEYQSFGQQLASALGCDSTDIACFRSKSPTALNASAPVTAGTTITSVDRFQVCVDGKIVPVDPLSTGAKVPFMAGTNTLEGTLFTLEQYFNPASITAADYATYLDSNFGSLASVVGQYYPLSLFNSTPYPSFFAISTIITESAYFCPSRRALKATIAAGVPVWTYQSSHIPTCPWEPFLPAEALPLLGATHTSEIPLVFGQLTDLPLPNGTCSLDAQEIEISKILVSAWTSMAATGSPAGGSGISGGPWPQYNLTGSSGLLISNTSTIGYVNYTICDFWDQIQATELNATTTSGNSTSVSPNASSTASSTSSAAAFTGTATGSGIGIHLAYLFVLTAAFGGAGLIF